jgi:anti-anti-sigma factor
LVRTVEVSMSTLFELELVQVDGTALLFASGELDLLNAPVLRETLQGLHGTVTLDLSEVTFLDSSCIGVLIGQRNRLLRVEGDLVLRRPGAFVRRTLEVVGLGDWIEEGAAAAEPGRGR